MRRGLVLEGGAMRGLWTAGILDVMMEAGVEPDGIIGVSAGAAFGCNYKSRQVGRAIRYNMRFARDKRYSGWQSLLKTGDYFNAEFGYHVVPKQYDVFDDDAFEIGIRVMVQEQDADRAFRFGDVRFFGKRCLAARDDGDLAGDVDALVVILRPDPRDEDRLERLLRENVARGLGLYVGS